MLFYFKSSVCFYTSIDDLLYQSDWIFLITPAIKFTAKSLQMLSLQTPSMAMNKYFQEIEVGELRNLRRNSSKQTSKIQMQAQQDTYRLWL